MSVRLLQGDCRVTLATLDERSVQTCISSPPYWGLRSYGTPDLVWGQTCCEHPHEWAGAERSPWAGKLPGPNSQTRRNNAYHATASRTSGQFCGHVHDWQPVVKPAANGIVNSAMQGETLNGSSGTRSPSTSVVCACGAWLGSLGLEPTPDLYIQHIVECFRAVWRVLRDDGTLWLNLGDSYAGSGKGPSRSLQPTASQMQRVGPQEHTIGSGRVPGFKPKDLMMIPARVAMALQQDGWTLRAQVPWLKRNCMPESVTDRPATAVEYVYYLSKSRRCYWDAGGVRVAQSASTHERFGKNPAPASRRKFAANGSGTKTNPSFDAAMKSMILPNGRNRRNSDWFFESWQGLLLDDQDEPMALVVNTAPYRGAHYATFPPKLVEPMVKASTRPGDLVLDPFGGSGTVGMVADRLGRNAVLCELSDGYGEQAVQRVTGDAPMFTEVEVA